MASESKLLLMILKEVFKSRFRSQEFRRCENRLLTDAAVWIDMCS